jgi:hypothetical protein
MVVVLYAFPVLNSFLLIHSSFWTICYCCFWAIWDELVGRRELDQCNFSFIIFLSYWALGTLSKTSLEYIFFHC